MLTDVENATIQSFIIENILQETRANQSSDAYRSRCQTVRIHSTTVGRVDCSFEFQKITIDLVVLYELQQLLRKTNTHTQLDPRRQTKLQKTSHLVFRKQCRVKALRFSMRRRAELDRKLEVVHSQNSQAK